MCTALIPAENSTNADKVYVSPTETGTVHRGEKMYGILVPLHAPCTAETPFDIVVRVGVIATKPVVLVGLGLGQ
jgi:hypothetical protein